MLTIKLLLDSGMCVCVELIELITLIVCWIPLGLLTQIEGRTAITGSRIRRALVYIALLALNQTSTLGIYL